MNKIQLILMLTLLSKNIMSNELEQVTKNYLSRMLMAPTSSQQELYIVEPGAPIQQYYANEIAIGLQPEIGISIANIPNLKLTLSMEFTYTRKLPSDLELDKP